MHQSKLLVLLRRLSSKELTAFQDFVHCSAFNTHKEVRMLCDWLMEEAPYFSADSAHLHRTQIMEALSCSATRLYTLTSYLLDTLNDFLAHQQFHRDRAQKLHYLLPILRQQGEVAAKQYKSLSRTHALHLTRSPLRDATHFWQSYQFHKELDRYQLASNIDAHSQALQTQSDALDCYYVVSKLRIACDMLNRNLITKSDYQIHLLEEIEALLPKYAHVREEPAVWIYTTIWEMLRHEDDACYTRLKELLEVHISAFSMEELREMYDYAENHCIRQINKGLSGYIREMWYLYRRLLQREIIFQQGILSERDYKNIVTVGLRVREFEWTEEFIRTYKVKLPEHMQQNAFAYNLAAFYYETKQYTQALRRLHNVEFTDSRYYIGAKIIQAKSYYELHEFEALQALGAAFRQYLNRKKQFSSYWQQSNLNFIKLTQRIAQLREQQPYISAKDFARNYTKIGKVLKDTKPLGNAAWVQQIFETLGQKIKN